MKVLIISPSDILDGGTKASYRLHRALLSEGLDSFMLVQTKLSDDPTVIEPESKLEKFLSILRPYIDQLPVKFYKNKTKTPFCPAWVGCKEIIQIIEKIKPDIVHIHSICRGTMKIEDLLKIKKPIVLSLHDMWFFTGGCSYNENCNNFTHKCGNCKVLGSNKEKDLSRWVWNRKYKVFRKIDNLTIVGVSKWITDCSKSSTLLKDKKHVTLPNPIDTNIFKPFDKNKARELWNLPKNKKLILFGAMSATSNPRKGFKQLSEALKKFNRTEEVELVVFGSSKPKNPPKFGFKTHYVGRLKDDISLVTLYSAADVMVVPSLQENLSNTIMESLACATPVVAFDTGGNSDMIEHKKNGYLAKPFDTNDLKNGIEWVLNTKNYNELCINARKKVLKNFDSKVVAKKYIKLYEDMTKNKIDSS